MAKWEWLEPRLESVIAHMEGVGNALYDEAGDRERVAHGILLQIRETTTHEKIDQDAAHETDTSYQRDPETRIDSFFCLDGKESGSTSAMSIEFGHLPSGYFAPERYGRKTKAPEGHYILHRAAGLFE